MRGVNYLGTYSRTTTLTTMVRSLCLLALSLCLQAVEVPATVVRVIDGDTVETSAGTVRLLWIDTPESRGNAHGPAMPEGKAATAFLEGKLAKDAKLTLWGPGEALEKDRYQRVLAVIWLHEQQVIGAGNNPGTLTDVQVNVNAAIIRAGWSPYWRKYGQAPEKMHKALLDAQEEAQTAKVGTWATSPQWMTDKANETTAPKGKAKE